MCQSPNRPMTSFPPYNFVIRLSFQESSSLHNLAGVKKIDVNGTHESASLLEPHSIYSRVPRTTTTVCIVPSGGVANDVQQPSLAVAAPTATTVPRKRKFEQFLKNLVSRRPSKEPPSPPLISSPAANFTDIHASNKLISSGGGKSPSEHNLSRLSKQMNGSTTSLNSVHHKLWSVVPLLRKNGSCGSLATSAAPRPTTFAGVEYTGLRKCETVLALTHSQSHQLAEPIKPLNRLRNCGSVATCSRCSSLLSLAAAGSKYSLNVAGGGFIPVVNTSSSCSGGGGSGGISSSVSSSHLLLPQPQPIVPIVAPLQQHRLSGFDELTAVPEAETDTTPALQTSTSTNALVAKNVCKLCLGEYKPDNMTRIGQCGCSFCTEVS